MEEMTTDAPTKKTGPPNSHRFTNKANETKMSRVEVHLILLRTDMWLGSGLGPMPLLIFHRNVQTSFKVTPWKALAKGQASLWRTLTELK